VKKVLFIIALVAIVAGAWAQGKEKKDKDKDKGGSKKPGATRIADAGSFGIFVNGKRIGTETFRIEDGADSSVATSEIKVEDNNGKADQTSEMRIGHDGNLRLYHWRSTSPTKEETVVEPNDELLIEHVTPADQKKVDVPHILPLTTSILDDNFFSHREILAWRYLRSSCIYQEGRRACSPGVFGILVPRQHLAANAKVVLVGRNAIQVKGVERELNEFTVDTGGSLWLMWMTDEDGGYKVMKISIPSDGVEVIRD
jgi:hypothetical protein